MILATFKDSLNEILKNGGLYIAISFAVLIIFTVVFLLIKNRKSK